MTTFKMNATAQDHGLEGRESDTGDSGSKPTPARRMKVVFLIDRLHYDLGGTEGQVMKLVRGLSPRVDLELVVLESGQWIREQAEKSGLKITIIDMAGGVKSPGFWLAFARLTRHLKAAKPDVVHTFFPISNILGAVAARLAGVSVVVGSRRDYGYWMTPAYLRFQRWANGLVSRIVTNSPEVKRFTVAKEGYDASQIEVIYNGLELDNLRLPAPDLALKAELGIPTHHHVVVLVANFRPIKRQDTLVEAMALIRQHRDDVSVVLVGDPHDPFHDKVAQLIDARQLGSHVKTAHAQGDVERYLSIAEIGCNCSESEGLSNAVMEYMGAGVACIVSDGGGNKDLIAHAENGLVFPVGDHAMLAQHILKLVEDPSFRRKMVDASQLRLRKEMSMPVILGTFERFYRSLLR